MDFIEEINRYVKSKEHTGALLFTGKWGSGKSYQINLVKKIFDEDKIIIVVSLFGLENRDDIEKAIKDKLFDELYLTRFGIKKEFKENTSKLFNLLSQVKCFKPLASISLNKYDLIYIKKNIKIIGKNESKELILVFDDFERSKMNVVNLLGIINNFCENEKIKVIIVADEDKIGEKYQESNYYYKDFKEKVVQTTLDFKPDYNEIITNIINSYEESSKGYKDYLCENISKLYQVFIESEYFNLRTFKTILIEFERVYNIFIKNYKDKSILSNILYSYSVMFFEIRRGNFNNEYGYLIIDKEKLEKYTLYNRNGSALNSLKTYVYTYIFDSDAFENELKNKYFNDEEKPEISFLYSDFWGLNSKIIDEGFPKCLELAYKGDLGLDEYITILRYSAAILNNGIKLPCKIDFNKMNLGLDEIYKKIMNGVTIFSKSTFVSNDQIEILGQEAINFNNALERFNDKIDSIKNKRKIFISLELDCDFTGLYNISIDTFDNEFREKLYNAYINADNFVKREIAVWFKKLHFNNDYCSDEKDIKVTVSNINILKKDINECIKKEKDQFANVINIGFLEILDNIIKSLR